MTQSDALSQREPAVACTPALAATHPLPPHMTMTRTGAVVDLMGVVWTMPTYMTGGESVFVTLDRLDAPHVRGAAHKARDAARRESSLSEDLRHAMKLYLVHRMARLAAHSINHLWGHLCHFERFVYERFGAATLTAVGLDFALFAAYADACRDASTSRGAAPTTIRSFYAWAAERARLPGFDRKQAARMRRMRLPSAVRGHIVRMACPRRGALDENEQLQIDRAIAQPAATHSRIDFYGRVVAGLCRDLGCRPAALVRLSRAHRAPPVETAEGTRYLIREPLVKQGQVTDETRDRGLSAEVGVLVEELFASTHDQVLDAPLLHFLFTGRYRARPTLKLGRLLQAWADVRDISTTRISREDEGPRNSRLAHNVAPVGARIVLFPYRFRRTLASTMAEQGATEQEIAEALGDRTVAMAAVYVETSSYIVDVLARTLDKHPEWVSVVRIFLGKLATESDAVLPAILAGAPHLADYADFAEAGVAGYCAKQGDCDLWLPLSCYECPFFRASREADVHERQLLQVVRDLDASKGVESDRLQESLARAVRAITQLLVLLDAEKTGTLHHVIQNISAKRARPTFTRPAAGKGA